jgi:ATP-dependent Lon protease
MVLLPGALVPLHIFEPRYRQMLQDCLITDRRFGLLLAPSEAGERFPPSHAGCIAVVHSFETLPDGRSNIIVTGEARFTLDRLLEIDTPYLIGSVSMLEDLPEDPEANAELASRVRSLFDRAARAARTLSNERASVPELDSDSTQLAFQIANLVDFGVEERQQLLSSPSPRARLDAVHELLASALPSLEARAAIHRRAQTNGHGDIES